MGLVLITESYLQNIANAIRSKYGSSTKYTPANMANAILNIPGGGATINNQTKTISPTESTQTITADSGYTGLSTVTISGISPTYVGTGVATQAAATITPSSVAQTAVSANRYTTGAVIVGAVPTETQTVTPTRLTQYITPTMGNFLSQVTVNPIPSNFVIPAGTLNISSNGTEDVSSYAAVNVSVSGGSSTPGSLQIDDYIETTDVSPDTTGGVLSFAGVGSLGSTFSAGEITTNPTPSSMALYLISDIPVRTSNDLTVNSNVVTAPAGYYLTAASTTVSAGNSNIVAGTFKTQTTTAATQTITIPYTGSGYPIAAMVWVDGGVYNPSSTWYTLVQRYAVGFWSMTKAAANQTPTYTTSGVANQAVPLARYKSSASASTSYSQTGASTTNIFTSSAATGAALTCCRFKGNAKTLNIYVASTSYGLLANTTYRYMIEYSS